MRPLCLLAAPLLLACGETARRIESPLPSLSLQVDGTRLLAPRSVAPGWTRVSLQRTEASHIPVVFRLSADSAPGSVRDFITALDTLSTTPTSATAIGGPEFGDDHDVVLQLTPGRYVVACVRRGDDGHRHAHAGEYAEFDVRAASSEDSAGASAPMAVQELRLADFAFTGTAEWDARQSWLRLQNTGKQDHQLRLARLNDGVTLQMWADAENPNAVSKTAVGMARLGPGETAYVPLSLSPGRYVAYCLIGDPASKQQHIELGMLREIVVR